MTQKNRVLVIGEDTCAFLATIRSLGRFGLEVHIAWCSMDAPALKSRYVTRVHQIPPYRPETDDWIHAFRGVLQREKFDLVLPIIDRAILPLQLHRAEFEPFARFSLLSDDTYRICSDKLEMYNLAKQEGLPLPRQRIVRNAEELLGCAAEFGYPVVLKPKRSAERQKPEVRQVVRKAHNEHELLRLAKQMSEHQEMLAQENFVGYGLGVEVLCSNGHILTAFQHERVHEPMMGGGSSYRKSVPLDADMYAATARLMEALRYTGVAMLELKRNRTSGEWIMVEINSRFWGSLPLSIAAGLDFPRYLYEMLVEDRRNFPRTYRVGKFSRNWTKDMQWFLVNLRADKRDPLLQSRRLGSVLGELRNIPLLRETSDTLAFDDPGPAVADLAQFFGEKTFSVLKRLWLYRKLEHRRLIRLYRSAMTIVIMCYGNICRSPFAAAVLSCLDTTKTASSAGTYPKIGRESPDQAVEAATTVGVDLSGHLSRVATSEELRSADLILIFDRRNWLAIRSMCPEVMSRVAYLGAADPSAPLEIPDPFGGGAEDFRACYGHIRRLMVRMVESSVELPARSSYQRNRP